MTAWEPLIVTLLDGSLTTSDSEDYRHETHARELLRDYPLEARREMLALLERKRGKPVADRLRATMTAIYEKSKAEQGA